MRILIVSAFTASILLYGVVGCMAARGAGERVASDVAGVDSKGPPPGSSSTDVILYSIGSAVAGAVISRFLPKKKGVA